MRICSKLAVLAVASLWMGFCISSAFAQSTNAELSGRVTDPNGLPVPKVKIEAVNVLTNISTSTETNEAGIYVISSLQPAIYRILIEKEGFDLIVKPNVELHVQDHGVLNFQLRIGSLATTVTVEGGAPLVNTESAAVSTVVDRQFAENLPLNGRSFQTLIELTPGVVLVPTNAFDSGQFSVNGQRPTSNYWMVDGVSANIGTSPLTNFGNGVAGSVGGFSALGGTNSLVSVDAMQEFRIQTSTYAPEFGRTPGGQISIVTRSGTNSLHGTLFDYIRNDALDAHDWFDGTTNPPLPKAKERQNDFGGTFNGPLIIPGLYDGHNRTFFFLSYEGLRLRLPQTTLTTVPDASFTPGGTTNSRQNAIPAVQPYLNAFPLPNANSPEIFTACTPNVNGCPASGQKATGAAQFNASYSNPSSLDAYSIRLDHRFTDRLNIFARYNSSPSEVLQRGLGGSSLSTVVPSRIHVQTATLGSTFLLSTTASNDLRFNYSRVGATSTNVLTDFGGAVVPSIQSLLPPSVSPGSALFQFSISSLTQGNLLVGNNSENIQRQYNVIEAFSLQRGSHAIKSGVDYRRLLPIHNPEAYLQGVFFSDVPSASMGTISFALVGSLRTAKLLIQDLGLYAQDTWRLRRNVTLTYGVRYDINFVPSSTADPSLVAVTGFENPANLSVAPSGTPIFDTKYGNIAPRVGIAYQVFDTPGHQTVIRGGYGIFYDLATQEVGGALQGIYPFIQTAFPAGSFPLSPTAAAPPPIALTPTTSIEAFDPKLKLPYTQEWNVALEQGLGMSRSFSVSYVGAVGRRLIETAFLLKPGPNVGNVTLVTNAGTSDYHALQAQFQQRVAKGLQALASYTWSHSIDTGSASSRQLGSNIFSPALGANSNRGPSDFDVRHAFSTGITYNVPGVKGSRPACAITCGWSVESVIQARSAPPVDVFYSALRFRFFRQGVDIRPDVVPGTPFYLFGSQYPGGKALNPAAFTKPPLSSNGTPLRQGDLGRNALRGFGAAQWDFAVHRDFPIHESLKLQFRAEMFNVLNHPNFGTGVTFGDLSNAQFGRSIQMLNRSLDASSGGAAFNPLYQFGGPRSIQFALKFVF